MPHDLQTLIDPVRQIAQQAGTQILKIYDTVYDVAEKADQSPLTEADLAAHRTIHDGLSQLTPDIPILSEESSDIPFSERSQWHEYWLVDPLDGTREFISHNGEFTVNIALIRDHKAVMGVVHIPIPKTDYFGWENGGAYVQYHNMTLQTIHTCPYTSGPIRVVGSRSHRGNSLEQYLVNLGDHELVSMGSSIKLCLVAEGKADIYPRLGPTSEWDTAAAQAVVECAGGYVVDTHGEPLRYNTKDAYLNPFFLVYGDAGHDWLRYL